MRRNHHFLASRNNSLLPSQGLGNHSRTSLRNREHNLPEVFLVLPVVFSDKILNSNSKVSHSRSSQRVDVSRRRRSIHSNLADPRP